MNGVMMPSVSAGSSQRDASVMCTPHVIVPSGAAAARDAGNVIASERINTTARRRTTSMRMRPSLRAPTVKPQTEVHEIGWDRLPEEHGYVNG